MFEFFMLVVNLVSLGLNVFGIAHKCEYPTSLYVNLFIYGVFVLDLGWFWALYLTK